MSYNEAIEKYSKIGVDTEKVLEQLAKAQMAHGDAA